jgi:hypothetical protein
VHPIHAEVPRRHVTAEHLGEGQHEAAHARVDVAVRTDRGRERRDLRDRVDDALRVLRGRPDDEHGAVVDGTGHRVDVGGPVVAHRHLWIGMSNRCADLWNAAWADSATTISPAWMPRSARPRSRAARTAHWIDSVPPLVRNPAAVGGPCSSSGPGDDLALDRAERRERLGVQRVLVQVQHRGTLGHLVHRRPTVVHHPERATVLPSSVMLSFGLEVGDDVVDRPAGSLEFHASILTRDSARPRCQRSTTHSPMPSTGATTPCSRCTRGCRRRDGLRWATSR